MTTIGIQNPKVMPASVRRLIRPMLFLALGLHAFLLFIPLPSEKKLKEADDKKDPIKIIQVPTATPASAKPKPKPAVVKLTGKPAIVATAPAVTLKPSVAPVSTRPSPPLQSSARTIPAASTLTTATSSTAPPPATPSPSHSDRVTSTSNSSSASPAASFKGDPAQALHEFLTNLSLTNDSKTPSNSKAPSGGSSTNLVAPLEEITRPELLFKSVARQTAQQSPEAQKVALEGLPGLDKQPLLVTFPLENNLNLYSFYEKLLEPKLKTIFETVSEVGDYGDGPLYKLTRGNYTAYLSLIPPKKAVGAIISVWTKDPRST